MKRFIAIILTVVALSATSCKNWLDINTNPNYLSDAEPSQLLPTALAFTAEKLGYDINIYTLFWAQYAVQCKSTNQYYTNMTYDVTNSSFTSPWTYIYAQVLPSLKKIINSGANAAGMSNYVLEAKTMVAYNFYLLNSLYGPIAYTEGFVTESQTPKFDEEKAAYTAILGLLEEVRGMSPDAVAADELANSSAKADMLFDGDTDLWFQFANTLYLRMLMRDPAANSSKIAALIAEDNFLSKDAAFAKFEDSANKSNPLYESDQRQLNTKENIRACSDILGVISEKDPRLPYFYDNWLEDESGNEHFAGAAYGTTIDHDESAHLAIAALDPVYFATVDETYFLIAEYYARNGKKDEAEEAFNDGLVAAFVRTGIDAVTASTFIAANYAFDSTVSIDKQVEQIINHKWASNVRCMPTEAWFDMTRTGYPAKGTTITDYQGVISGYPQRFLISKTSADYNPNSPTGLKLTDKMWWQK